MWHSRGFAHWYWLYTYPCLPEVVCSTDFLFALGSPFGRSPFSVGLESSVVDGTLLLPARSSLPHVMWVGVCHGQVSPLKWGERTVNLEKQEWPVEVTSAGMMRAHSWEAISFWRHSGTGDRAYNHRICGHNDNSWHFVVCVTCCAQLQTPPVVFQFS